MTLFIGNGDGNNSGDHSHGGGFMTETMMMVVIVMMETLNYLMLFPKKFLAFNDQKANF